MFASLFVFLPVCLSVRNFVQNLRNGFAWNFQGRLAIGQWTKWLNFGGDPPDHRLDTGIDLSGFVTIGRYGKWYQPSALRDAAAGIVIATMMAITSPADDRQPRETCLGGGMHCRTASIFIYGLTTRSPQAYSTINEGQGHMGVNSFTLTSLTTK